MAVRAAAASVGSEEASSSAIGIQGKIGQRGSKGRFDERPLATAWKAIKKSFNE